MGKDRAKTRNRIENVSFEGQNRIEYIQYTRLVLIDEKNCSKNGKRLKGKCKNGKCPPWHVSSLERVLISKCPQRKVPRMAMDSVPMANVKFLEWQVSK